MKANEPFSKKIASILGPALLAVTISEALNLHIWTENYPPLTYLNGMILFIGGLAIVRFHNFWRLNWAVLVTLTGWVIMAGGLFRLFFPEAPQAETGPAAYAFIGGLCLTGAFLTFKAYR